VSHRTVASPAAALAPIEEILPRPQQILSGLLLLLVRILERYDKILFFLLKLLRLDLELLHHLGPILNPLLLATARGRQWPFLAGLFSLSFTL
jgi:hypothetical protein